MPAFPAFKNFKAVFTGPISGSSDNFKNIVKMMHNKIEFLSRRIKVIPRFADLWARISVKITKRAKVIDAS